MGRIGVATDTGIVETVEKCELVGSAESSWYMMSSKRE